MSYTYQKLLEENEQLKAWMNLLIILCLREPEYKICISQEEAINSLDPQNHSIVYAENPYTKQIEVQVLSLEDYAKWSKDHADHVLVGATNADSLN